MSWELTTPVAFFVYRRPDTTRRVFAEIARARPGRLYVFADGPRTDRPGEVERCEEVRSIVSRVDWDCEVSTEVSPVNLGSRRRVSSGLARVFAEQPEAIVLEDDCLPHATFFRFAQEVLGRYRDDERVFAITGNDFQGRRRGHPYSYYFSGLNHIWGWGTWRRSWRHYDVEMARWPEIDADPAFRELFDDARVHGYWRALLQQTYERDCDAWDYQWHLACWLRRGLCVVPNGNLVSNIGFGGGALHTTHFRDPLAELPVHEMRFPLRHPPVVQRDVRGDHFVQRFRYGPQSFPLRLLFHAISAKRRLAAAVGGGR